MRSIANGQAKTMSTKCPAVNSALKYLRDSISRIKKMAGIIWASHYNKTIRNDGYDTYTSIYIPLKEKKKKI